MKRQIRNVLLVPGMAALVLLVDQISKYLVSTRLREGQSWDIAPWLSPFLRITHTTNTGAAFGLFPQWGNFFILIAAVVIVAILVYQRYLPGGQQLVRIALGLQLGGAIGNLADRLIRGSVVDFLDLSFWPLREWPVFNLADTSIVTGVSLLALLMLWEERCEQGGQRAIADADS